MKRSYIIFLVLAGVVLAGVVLAGCGGATGKGRDSDVRNANEMRTRYSRIMINAEYERRWEGD